MKFSTFILAAAAIGASVNSSPLTRRDVDPALVPDFGVTAGVNPDGTGYARPLPFVYSAPDNNLSPA